ncbi:TerD family protein [Endozoicomonas ascidiicola]|uniref:TerD family protein n=1 Tax=Endozoicomonas ascidiicola TaxID=1698521 RepID=UPI00082BA247|nr:TerD family protein [Endozoicomonas ascidiicola]USN27007.1 tellurium resistance TerZ family protein [synthetic construct]
MAISLQKGQRISLKKESGSSLQSMCIGVNWGAIIKKGFFGGQKVEAVDLDASVGIFDENSQLIDTVSFRQLKSRCGGIVHSGDDLTGDVDGDDGLDNEVIKIDLNKLNPKATQLAFVLNSFRGHDFKDIPFARIRIYEGTPERVDQEFARFDIANDASFSGAVSMIMGKLYKHNGEWKFNSIGQATRDTKLEQTLASFSREYA